MEHLFPQLSTSSASSSALIQKNQQQQSKGKQNNKIALKKKVDDLLQREAAWKRQKALQKASKQCCWADCPYAEVCIETDMWTHIKEDHVFWQPYFTDDGRLVYANETGGDDQQEENNEYASSKGRSTRNQTKDYVCLWEQCPQAKRLMKKSDLLAHIKRCHLVKLPKKAVEHPSKKEYTAEVLKFMEEEVKADLRAKARLAPGEPAFKEKVLMVDGGFRDLKPGEVLSDGEKMVLVLDDRFLQANRRV